MIGQVGRTTRSRTSLAGIIIPRHFEHVSQIKRHIFIP